MKLPCVLLAAGGSTRMERNKLLVTLSGETVLHRTARNALSACSTLIVVTGSQTELMEAALADLEGIVFVHNPDWQLGMAASAIAGIAKLTEATASTVSAVPGFFLHHADMPFVSPEVYLTLTDEVEQCGGESKPCALVPAFRGIPGHPVFFPMSYIPEIRKIRQGESLKSILAFSGFRLIETGLESVIDDCDTVEDFRRLASRYGLEPELRSDI